jgi:hypothetical protein
VTSASDAWHFEIEAAFSLDRLIFEPNELRLSREAQRIAAHRQALVAEVARLYFARRRLQIAALLDGDAGRPQPLERTLEIDELTAILDGLTGGLLSRGRDP